MAIPVKGTWSTEQVNAFLFSWDYRERMEAVS
jgi:hypothetical protein